MKKKVLVVLAISALLLSGCGDTLYEMSDQEESQIVTYAARVIGKYNIYQKDGETYVDKAALTASNKEKDETSSESATEAVEDTEGQEDGLAPDANTTGQTGTEESGYTAGTWAEALGCTDLTVTYLQNYLSDSYMQEGVYDLEAGTNKTFMVLEFTVTNTGTNGVNLDVVTNGGKFYLELPSESKVAAEQTFFGNDLADYEGEIAAGSSVNVIMLFKMSKTQAESASAFSLLYKKDNTMKQLALQ